MARGVIMQNLGNRMVTIMDLEDGAVIVDAMTESAFKARKRNKTVPTRRTWTRMSKVSNNVSCLTCLDPLLLHYPARPSRLRAKKAHQHQ